MEEVGRGTMPVLRRTLVGSFQGRLVGPEGVHSTRETDFVGRGWETGLFLVNGIC